MQNSQMAALITRCFDHADGPAALPRADAYVPGVAGQVGCYTVWLYVDANRVRVTDQFDREIFNRVRGVNEIVDWVVDRGEDGVAIALKRTVTAAGHVVIWLSDWTDDNYGIGLDLTSRQLTEWGEVPSLAPPPSPSASHSAARAS